MDRVALAGLVFYGYHGVLPEERKLGQRFVVDLDLFGNFGEAGEEDSLEKAVDYVQAFELIRGVVEGKPCQLLETVALRICRVILDRLPRVEQVTVRVKKPHVPIPAVLDGAFVEISRSR